jgi:hypothetical protein
MNFIQLIRNQCFDKHGSDLLDDDVMDTLVELTCDWLHLSDEALYNFMNNYRSYFLR